MSFIHQIQQHPHLLIRFDGGATVLVEIIYLYVVMVILEQRHICIRRMVIFLIWARRRDKLNGQKEKEKSFTKVLK